MEEPTLAMNPRYVAYCQAHGKTPEEMMDHDVQRWPGGCMCGFLLWSNRMLYKAREAHPDWFINTSLYNHVAYDAWMQNEVK